MTSAAQTEAGDAQSRGRAKGGRRDVPDDVVRRTIYTTPPTEFETSTAAIERVQQSTEHPAQTIAGVTGLAVPGLLIEIEATVSLS